MSLLEELAGAAAAVIATNKLDPGASLLTEGVAAFAGYKGVEAITDHLKAAEEEKAQQQTDADPQAGQS